jgi:hypothetical protein
MVHRKKLSKPGIGLGSFDPEAFAEYVRCFDWKTIKGSCADYRACATCNFAMDQADFAAGHKITQRLLVIWGAKSHAEGVYGDVLGVWQRGYTTRRHGRRPACAVFIRDPVRQRRRNRTNTRSAVRLQRGRGQGPPQPLREAVCAERPLCADSGRPLRRNSLILSSKDRQVPRA